MGELPSDYSDLPAGVVVNLCGIFPRTVPMGTIVFAYPLEDSLDAGNVPDRGELERFLAAVHKFAEDAPSYWHCHAGLNRSGLAVAAYLHLYRDLPIGMAIDTLRRSRSEMVLCNSTFERALREWYGDGREREFVAHTFDTWLREHL
jgi:protein-tyrosine phosphatase